MTGYAKDAAVETGDTYQLVGKQSGKAVADTTSGDSALSLANVASDAENAKKQTWTFTQIEQPADSERPDLKAYVITNAEGKVLVSKDGTNALSNETVEAAKSDPAAKWILNTSDGSTYQLLNAATKTNLDVDNSGTTDRHEGWLVAVTERHFAVRQPDMDSTQCNADQPEDRERADRR